MRHAALVGLLRLVQKHDAVAIQNTGLDRLAKNKQCPVAQGAVAVAGDLQHAIDQLAGERRCLGLFPADSPVHPLQGLFTARNR